MGKRRTSRKSSMSSQSIDVSEIAKQLPTNKTYVEKRDTDSTEIQTYNVVTTHTEEIDNESFVLDCENSVNVVPAALIEVNNNTTELVDKNSAEVSNDCILTGHQKKGKENTESSQEKRDLFKNLLKFLKKSIEKAKNFDDDQAFVDVFKNKQLYNLCREAAKLHKASSLRPLPFDKMDFIVAILNKIISHGNGIVVSNSQDNCYALSSKSDPVFKGVYACLLQLYIWTSPDIDKKLINDEGIENVTLFLKLCLDNVVFPAYNMNSGSNGGSMKKNVGNKKANEVDKITLQLYNDLTEAVQLLELLLRDQTLTDTHILRINSFSIPAFFVKNIGSIQLTLLKLVECVFSKYKKLRKVMLDDLISCLEKAAGDLKQYESYKLESGGKIQMLTALLMKMVQSVVHFPLSLLEQNEVDVKVVAEEKIGEARNAAIHFMQSLLRMCCENTNEGLRGAVVSLVQDLLAAVDRPEWPVSEIMLHMFLFVLFENHHASHQKRLLSLEFLTAVYSALQEKSKKHQQNEHKIDQLFENMQRKDEPDEKCRKIELEDSKKVELLQNALLDFIARRENVEPALLHARHLHLAHWYIERTKTLLNNSEKPVEKPVAKRRSSSGQAKKTPKGKSPAKSSTSGNKSTLSQNNSNMKMLLNKFHDKPVLNMNSHHVEDEDTRLFIDVGMAQLITHSFLSKRSLHLNFNSYLTLLLSGLKDTSTPVRLKAMRCLSHLIVVAPDVLSLKNVEAAVKAAVYDQSIAIRESAIDIISKIVLKKSNMDDCNITLLSERILDTGVSVRKKVIKTLGDLCLKFPASQKTPEIAAKIMKRISDEPGVHNMVLEFFYKLWFLPIDSDAEPELANRRISSIVNVMNLCMAAGLDSFETLLTSLMNPNDDVCDRRGMKNISADEIFEVSQKIVDVLVRKMLDESATHFFSPQMASVFLFAKLKPKLVVRHIDSLHKLLHFTHQTANTQLIIYNLRTIELAIPLLKHANQNMMQGLESNFEKIIISQERTVIQSCISCMKMFIEKLSQNFEFVAHLMKKYYDLLVNYSTHIEKLLADNEDDTLASVAKNQFRKMTCKRAFFVVGLLMRYFNFCDKQVCCNILPMTITDDIVCVLDKFCRVEDGELKLYAVMAMGNVCVRYCKLMFKDGLKGLYCNFLSNAEVATELKVQVLQNLTIFLEYDRERKMAQFNEWKERSKKESLKLMEDVASGLSSAIIQLFLQEILALTVHKQLTVRQAAQKLIHVILQQGLVNPVQLVPHLIAMSTEDNAKLRVSAEKHIYDIEQRYPGFVHMKAQAGLELAFGLQRATQSRDCVVVHGYRVNETTNQREALLGCLYSALHTKPHKRAFVSSLVKRFDQQSDIDAKILPFLVDNLAYFNYEVIGEPLFVIHTIDVFLSVHGTSVLQAFEEALLPAENQGTKSVDEKGAEEGENEEDEDYFKEDNAEDLLKRMPQNIQPLVDCLKSFHKYLLLLSLNQYLKTEFNISDSMMYDYSTSESSKVFEKSLLPLEKTDFDVELIVQKIEGYISDCSAESLIENYIKFKRLIMKFDLKRSHDDDMFITAKLQTVSKNKGSKPTKRRSYKKCHTSDDEDEEAEISKSKKKKTPSKKEGNSSTTPVVQVLVKTRVTRSSLKINHED